MVAVEGSNASRRDSRTDLRLLDYREPSGAAETVVAEFFAPIARNFRKWLSKLKRLCDTQLANIKPTALPSDLGHGSVDGRQGNAPPI
jgi:hypothetical protein